MKNRHLTQGWDQIIGHPKPTVLETHDELIQSSFPLVIGNKGIGLERVAGSSKCQNYEGAETLDEETYKAQLSHFNNRALQ